MDMHMFVYTKCVCLPFKVTSAHNTPHHGHFVAWVLTEES